MWSEKLRIIVPILKSCCYLLVLFMAILSYMYGSLFKSSERAHNLKILAVDYDNQAIGQSLSAAYTRLQGPRFLSLHYRPASDFPIASVNEAICSHGYWGVIYTHPGATERLFAAVSGNTTAPYHPNDTITYVYSGVRYPVISQAFIAAQMQTLVAATSQVFQTVHGKNLVSAANLGTPEAISALVQPISPSSTVLFATEQGTRVLLNTITIVVGPLMQFFYVMMLDHVSAAMHLWTRSSKPRVYLARLVGSKIFTFMGGLLEAAVIFAFKEDWALSGPQFVEIWFCFWLYMDISYLIMDSVIGTVVPMRFAPFFIFTWIVVNMTSTLYPFEVNPGFYQIGYVFPAHHIWLLLMQIWSHGCFSQLKVALPVLLVWWILVHFTSAYAVWRKCAEAAKGQRKDVAVTAPSSEEVRPAKSVEAKSVESKEGGDI